MTTPITQIRSIDWTSLSAQERNAMIHAEVMGNRDALCRGSYMGQWRHEALQPRRWDCMLCHRHGDGTPHDETLDYTHYHAPFAPCYTSNLQAAWHVVEQIYTHYGYLFLLTSLYTEQSNELQYNALFDWQGQQFKGAYSTIPAEAICLAALHVVHPDWTVKE